MRRCLKCRRQSGVLSYEVCMKYPAKYVALALLGAGTFLATLTAAPDNAEAVVCARGVYRAGCAGRNGAVVARRPVYAPVYRAPVYRGPVRVYRRW